MIPLTVATKGIIKKLKFRGVPGIHDFLGRIKLIWMDARVT